MKSKNIILEQPVKDVSIDNLETVLDGFSEYFLKGEIAKIVIQLPVVKNISTAVSILGSVKNYIFLKKLDVFLRQLRSGTISKIKYANLESKYGADSILENILLYIDTMKENRQIKVYAYLFEALLDNKLSWDDFESLAFSLEHFMPRYLTIPVVLDSNKTNQITNGPIQALINVGLANTVGPVWGGDVHIMNDLGMKFWEFGLLPFQEKNKKL